MAFVTADRVRELSTTSGTGPMFLGGPVEGYQSFADGVGVGNSTFYAISVPNGAAWEVGVGTVAVGSLSRDTVLSSSNGGAKVNFPAGTKDVFATFAGAGAVVGVGNTIHAPAGARLPVANGGTGVATVEAEVSRLAEASNISELIEAIDVVTNAELQAGLDGKVDKVGGKQLSTEDYTTSDKNKLAGIESGAQVNTVTSVAGKTGAVALAKGDVGLGNVDNTSDASKPVSTATQNALNGKVSKSGDTMTGQLKIGTAEAIRLKDGPGSGGRAFILRKNPNILYFLVTDKDDADGGYNSLRPLYINLDSGAVFINGGIPWTTVNLNTGVGTDQVPKNSDFYQYGSGSWRVIRFPRKYQKLSYRVSVDLTGITWSGSSGTHRYLSIGVGAGVPFPFPFAAAPVCTVGGLDSDIGYRSAWISFVGHSTTTIQSIFISAVGTSPPAGGIMTINLEFSGIGT